jgi:hypothetical protein
MGGSSSGGAFSNAAQFQKFEFYSTNGIETVQRHAFSGSRITEFDVGPNLKSLNAVAFESVGACFVKFTSSGENSVFSIENNILYDFNKNTLICCPHGFISQSICSTVTMLDEETFHYSIAREINFLHSGITEISFYCFARANAEVIVIPETVHTIQIYSFKGCKYLKSIILPPVLSIEEGLLYECTRLRTVVMNNGTEKIGRLAFYKCNAVKEIYVPSSLTDISESAFDDSSVGKCGVRCLMDKRSVIISWKGFSVASFDTCLETNAIKPVCRNSINFNYYVILLIHS